VTTLHTASYPPAPATATRGLAAWVQRHPLWGYGLLAYGISWLFLLGALAAIQFDLLPADSPMMGVANQVAVFGPALAALIMIAFTQGRSGVGQWLRSLVQWRVGMHWYLFVLLGIPLIMLIGESVVHGLRPFQMLAQQWPVLFTRYLPYVAITTVLTGLGEESGWRGFAQSRFQANYGPLLGTFLLGLLWSGWHLPNLFFQPGGLYTFGLWFAATLVNAFVLAWVYNATNGSVLLVMLLHAAQNTTSRLVANLIGATDAVQFMNEYYSVSALTFGVVMLVVMLVTRGRLGDRTPV
jgi:membrane protease YdiL (CAAX protease family)